jgi:hypothetical protein
LQVEYDQCLQGPVLNRSKWEEFLRQTVFAAIVIGAWLLVASPSNFAYSQNTFSCPSKQGLPSGCSANPNPRSIPAGMGGRLMSGAECYNVKTYAAASWYSYDDAGCHTNLENFSSPYFGTLVFVSDAADVLPDNYKRVMQRANFRATLYCDIHTNTLILAFRGSISLTSLNDGGVHDWYYTNFLQHLGERPLQYEAAEDMAQLLQRELNDYRGICGSGLPKLVLTGHSKGGGQAQYAAVKRRLEAVVFNSDMVNPVVFSDWSLEAPAVVAPIVGMWVGYLSAQICFFGGRDERGKHEGEETQFEEYFKTGKITDVRMVNDPMTQILYRVCGNNLPHATIIWLRDTLSCSAAGHLAGHRVDNIVRELDVCGR